MSAVDRAALLRLLGERADEETRLVATAREELGSLLNKLAAAERERDQTRAELETATARSVNDLRDDEVDAVVRQVGLGWTDEMQVRPEQRAYARGIYAAIATRLNTGGS